MGDAKIRSGAAVMDWLLEGGYEKDVLTCLYGPPGSGKTNFLLMCLANSTSLNDKKIIYIDTEGNFSTTRFKQLCSNHEELLERVVFMSPVSFNEQRDAFEKLKKIVDEKVGLIILDSVAMLYRLELGKTKDVYNVNRELGLQLSSLTEIARKKHIPVLVTNQVYADFDREGNMKMVGGDILRYSSKCLIELRRGADGVREAILQKHRSLPDGASIKFTITDSGAEEVDDGA